MGFWDLPFMIQAFRFKRLEIGDERRRKKKKKKPLWLTPVSHGYYTVDRSSYIDGTSNDDSVFIQREQQSDEVWFFGVSKTETGKEIVKYMQNHLFDKLPNELGIMRKCKETLRKAYVEEERNGGSAASVVVVNGEKLVMVNIGGHRVVVCKDGQAHQISDNNRSSSTKHWSHIIFPVCNQGETEDESDPRNSKLVVVQEKNNSDTEFIIIGSYGIWEVIKNQEAINLIRHIEDPQEAAKCLAKEALNRISKNSISCIVIRFD